MAIINFNGENYTVDHAVKGADYIHGYDANGVLIVSFEGIKDFLEFSYSGTYMLPNHCLAEGCNGVRHVDGVLVRADGGAINPVMEIGVEYKTSENWFGEPVYTAIIDRLDEPSYKANAYTSSEVTLPENIKPRAVIRSYAWLYDGTIINVQKQLPYNTHDGYINVTSVSIYDYVAKMRLDSYNNPIDIGYRGAVQIWYIKWRGIAFRVASVPYEADENMTWAEWCNSSYNTKGYYVSGTNVMKSDGKYRVKNVKPTDIIAAATSYSHESYTS